MVHDDRLTCEEVHGLGTGLGLEECEFIDSISRAERMNISQDEMAQALATTRETWKKVDS